MNFTGKFDSLASGTHPRAYIDVGSIKHGAGDHPDKIVVPDAHLLFTGDYKRSGVDLILSKDGHELLIEDYFKAEKRASLASPDGAHLTGDIVNALAGNVEYAQAVGGPDPGRIIGHVTKLTGNATAIRNGVSIILNAGDNVEKGDVVQTGTDSQLGLTFIDGTVFGLSSSARMVLNEMVYDPNGSSNSSLLTLVAGTISFVAGETAKHGDMKVDTPTAVLGIRGTAVLVEIDFTIPGQGNTPAVNFQVLAEPDGHTGSYILYSKPTDGSQPVVIGRVDQSGLSYTVTANNQLTSQTAPALSPQAAAIIIQTFTDKFNAPPPAPPAPDKSQPTHDPSPNSTGGGGSSTPPPPATPLDTSPIKAPSVGPSTPTTTPINLTVPGPTSTPTTTIPTTPALVVAPAVTKIDVTPAVDTPTFVIPNHVTVAPAAPSDVVVPFVQGTGKVLAVASTSPIPAGVDVTKLITINEQTGSVSYDPKSFAFLKVGDSLTATIGFESSAGGTTYQETLPLTIDGVAQVPPTVAISNHDVTTNAATQTISGTVTAGTAVAGGTITLLDTVNGVTTRLGTTTVNSDGTWTATVTLTGDGTHNIVAQDTDAARNPGTSTPLAVTLDTVPPTVTITTAPETSNVATQAISGTVTAGAAAAGTTVLLYDTVNGVTSQIGTAIVGSDGKWTTNVTLSGESAHAIVALDEDAVGNIGVSAPVVFTLSTSLPPTVTIDTQGVVTNAAAQLISGTVIAGEAAVGGTVTLFDTVNGVTTQLGTATVGNGGAWSTSVTLSGDGTHSIVAQDVDTDGNLGASAPVAFSLDTVPPTVTIATAGTTSNVASHTLSGTVAAGEAAVGATVRLLDTVNGVTSQLGTATVGNDGKWTTEVTLSGDGVHSIVAEDTDTAGNIGSSIAIVFTLDTIPPTVTIGTASATTNQATHNVSGAVTAGEASIGTTVTLLDNGDAIGSATVGNDGAWSTSVTLSGDGAHSIVAEDRDTAGNVGIGGPVVFTLDTLPPTVTISTAGTTTNQTAQTISGTVTATEAAAGNTVTLFDTSNGVTTQIGTANVRGGVWSTNVTLSGNGTHSIIAEDTDAAGNTGSSSATIFTLATVAPTIAITSPIAGDNTINKGEAATGITISGTAAPGVGGTVVNGQTATITIIDGSNVVKDTYTTTVTGGAWSVNVTTAQAQALADGGYLVKADVSDAVGNVATTATQAITVDETAPTGGTPVLIAASDSGTSNTDDITNVTAPSFTVALGATVAAGDTVQLLLGGSAFAHPVTHTVTAADVTAGNVTLAVTAGDLGADGSKSITALFNDAAGNTSASSALNITLDTTAPTGGAPDLVAASDSGASSTDNITDVTAPNFLVALGTTAVAGDTVQLLLGGSAQAHPVTDTITAADVTAGSVTLAVTAGDLGADGIKSVTAQFNDAAGNTSTTSALSVTLDTTLPLVAITSAGGSTNQPAQTISGTVDPADIGTTVTLFDNGSAIALGAATVGSGGAWSTGVTLVGNGAHNVVAKDTDAAGNTGTSTAVIFDLNTTAPSGGTPDLIATSDSGTSSTDNITNVTTPNFVVALSSTVVAGDTVQLLLGGSALAHPVTHTVTAADVTAGTVTLAVTAGDLGADGVKFISAQFSDTFGNTSTSSALSVTLDTTAPTGGTPDLIAASDSGISSTDNITDVTAPSFSVALGATVAAGDTVQLLLGGEALAHPVTHTITAADLAAGSVTLAVTPGDLGADGTKSISALFSDAAGNTSTSSALSITLDTTTPTGGTPDLIAASDSGISSTDNITDVTAPNFVVALGATVAAGDTVQLLLSGSALAHPVTHTITAADLAAGSVTLAVTAGDLGADGTKSISALFSDAAGNTSTSSALSITLDTTTPTGGTPDLVAASDSGISSTDNITDVTAPSFSVALGATVPAGDIVQLLLGGAALAHPVTHTITAADVSAHSVTLAVTAGDLGADGSKSITARFNDTAGNTSTTSALDFTLDTTAPTAAITSTGGPTNQAGQTITGTVDVADAGATVTILDGTTAIGSAIVQSNGGWSSTVTLSNGSNTLTAQITDLAGNTAASSAVIYTLSTTGPTVTESLAFDTGSSATDHITSNDALSGTGLANTVVHFTIDGTPSATTVTANAVGGWSFTPSGLADGAHTIVASQTDTFGNTGTASLSFTLDTTAPIGGTPVLIAASDSGTSNTDDITNVTAPSFTVAFGATVAAGDTVQLLLGGSAFAHPVTHTVTAADVTAGNVTLAVTAGDLGADGTKSITALFSDAAGNTSTTSARNITLDTTAPTGGTPDLAAASDSGASSTDNITNVTAPSFTVALGATAVAGDTVQLLLGGSTLAHPVTRTITAADVASGSITLAVISGDLGADGTKSITARFTDAAGNTSTSSALSVTLDTTAPTGGTPDLAAASDSGTSSTDNITNVTAPNFAVTLGATAAAGDTVQLLLGGSALAHPVTHTITAADVASGSITLAVTAGDLGADGAKSISARFSDAAGNTSTTSALSIALDTAPPIVAISTAGTTTNQATQAISGTVTTSEAAAGNTVTLFDTVNGATTQIGTATVSGGAWSTNVTLSGNGTHSIVAKDTDAAGNTGSSAPVVYSLTVIPDSWANPNGGSWTVGANWSTGTVPSNTANVAINPIGATTPYSVSISSGATILANSLTLSDPFAELLDQGTLSIATLLFMSTGTLEIENGGTLSLGGSSAFTVNFAGTGGNLVLGNSSGFTGTVNAVSTADGAVSITGSGDVTTAIGDGIDLTTNTLANPSNLTLGLTGAITGAANGIDVIQNGVGNIAIATGGPIIGQAQRGIIAEESATGLGSVLINGSGNVTGKGSTFSGIVAENLNTTNASNVTVSQTGNIAGGSDGIKALTDGSGNVSVTTGAGATITGTNVYGIEAYSNSTGSISVTTATNGTITSGSAGISAYNQATSIPQAAGVTTSTITVTAAGTIDSGFLLTGSSSRPAGILAGYKGGTTTTPDSAVFGDVTVNSSATLNAAGGDGIRAYNYGSGNVTVNDLAGATITANDEFGIDASSYGVGDVTISTVASDVIDSGSSGVQAINLASAIAAGANSTVSVTARGTINSGTHLTPGGSQPQGISAGYYPGNVGAPNANVNGTVSIDNFANVTAAAGTGVNAYNWGNGNVTLTDEANTTVSGAQYGITGYSLSPGSGSVTINVGNNATISAGALYGLAGIQASENNAGNISITTSTGDVINSGGTGISANQATTAPATSKISITTFGTINSGFDTNQGGGQPGGIWAGYTPGGVGTVNGNVAGNVVVDNSAIIHAAAGVGIGLYNWGTGNITDTLESSSAIISATDGVNAYAQGGGNVTIINKGSITDVSGIGISAGTGKGTANSVSGAVSVNNSGTITSLGSSYNPVIQINNGSTQSATLTNSGTITANLLGKTSANQTVAIYNGSVTINNTGTISGNVSLNGGTFNNNAGGVWNTDGSDYFGSGIGAIINAGIINIAGLSFLSSGGSLTFANSNTVNVAPNGAAYISAAVTGTGIFTIGDRAELEFANSVAAGQTVSFADGNGLLTLDNPSTFNGSITGLAIGDAIDLQGIAVSSAVINGSTLKITETNNQTLTYQVSGALTGNTFSVLSGNEIILLPTSAITVPPGPSGPLSFAPSSSATYILSNVQISETGFAGVNIASSDSVTSDFLTLEISQSSSISAPGNIGVMLTTAGANIALINAGTIGASTARSSVGILVNPGSGSADVTDSGSVWTVGAGINVLTNGLGTINVVVGSGAKIDSSTSAGTLAIATSSGNIDVSTLFGTTINSGTSGIFAENQGTAVGSANAPSNILVSTSGSINSGSNSSGGEPAGILAGYLGGTSVPSSIPNPPISNVFGNVTVNNDANINAATGLGINAFNYGTGDITVSDASGTTITANAVATTTAGFSQYGIAAFNYGSGNTTVTTDFGSIINSGSTGINATDQATVVNPPVNGGPISTVTVIAAGAINSGTNLNNSGSAPAGIIAGFNPGNKGVLNPAVTGNVLVEYDGQGGSGLVAGAGDGISAFNNGVGNVEVDLGFNAAITALHSASAGSTAPYGVSAVNKGTGNITLTMSNGDIINSGSHGLNVSNQDTTIAAAANSMIAVTAAGTIISGTIATNGGSQPSGISAGYLGASTGANTGINGTVIVNNDANITAAAGSGINAYNYGNGNVTVNDSAGTTVSGAVYGISADAESGGTGNLTVNVGANATIKGTNAAVVGTTSVYGINAFSNDAGNISVITSSGDVISGSSSGISATNEATVIPQALNSSVVVTAYGTINTGTGVTGTGSPPAGISAGYLGGTTILTTYPLTTLFGDVVVNNFAAINATSGDGIRAYNFGIGDVMVNDFAGSITLQGQIPTGDTSVPNGYQIGINASNEGSGNINVMTAVGTSIDASLAGSGITAVNKAPAPTGNTLTIPATSHVSVLAYGTIKSGTDLTGSGDAAAGILASYNPANADTADNNVHGNVSIDDYASITAAAGTDGIRGSNYGTGTVTIIAEAGATITGAAYGIHAIGGDGGDIAITTHATLTGSTAAIDATTTSAGTITINNFGTVTGDVLSENATFDNEVGALWNLAGSSLFASGANVVINAGTIDTTGTSSITTGGTLSVTNTGTVNVQSGSLDIAAAVTGTSQGHFTIGSGAQLEFGASVDANQTVAFQGSTGTLKLDDATHFAGQISGLSGSDGIDLANFDAAHAVVTPVSTTTSTVLTVTDENHTVANGTAAIVALLGNYTNSTFNFSDDTHGGILIVDPPASAPVGTTIASAGTNQTLMGTGTPDNFVFNFANVGQATVTNFHADTDTLQFNSSIFSSVQAILDATNDDGHGNSVIALDAHDSITLAGVAKAQLSQTDLHLI